MKMNISPAECEILAKGLRQVRTQKDNSIWYQGGERYFDIFIEKKDAGIDWIQITFRGEFLEWSGQSIKFGKSNELKSNDDVRPASKVLETHQGENIQLFELIVRILELRNDDPLLVEALKILKTASH